MKMFYLNHIGKIRKKLPEYIKSAVET